MKLRVQRVGSMVGLFFLDGPVRNYDDARGMDKSAYGRFFWGMMRRGVYLPPAPFVVVGMADKRMGIVVDDLLGQQDVVIKSLGRTLSFVRGIAGAADLGNQRTILVLDVGGLMSETLRGDAAIYV